ncbi:MAG: ABC transporter ATP-binding protein [Lachnospiraceae bacterium]
MLLEVKELSIEFQDKLLPETVVSHVDFTLAKGEILGIVGESGSGKSMTAHAIAGLLSRHDMKKTGEILFGGKNLLTCSRAELRAIQGNDISVIFQEPMTSLNPVKKIGWQVGESLRIHTDLGKKEIKRQVLSILERVELSDPERVYNQYPDELSGGMRQRVMIASAMICRPQILIADEPTTALDVTIQAQIVKLLKKLNQTEKTAILFISHDLSLVKSLCERVIVMQSGRVVESGASEEIFRHPGEAYTRQLVEAIPGCEPGKSLREIMQGIQADSV